MSFKVGSKKTVIHRRTVKSNLLQYARENRDEGIFNDVTIVTDNETIAANRLVLACYSKYFELMFKSTMKERYSQTVDVQGASGKAVKAIVDYFYTETIEINKETVFELLGASDYLQVDDVKEVCIDYLKSIASVTNSIALFNFASMYGVNTLKQHVLYYIQNHLKALVQTEEFKSLSKPEFITFVTDLNRSNLSVSLAFKALITWIKHNQASRQTELQELFPMLIDLSLASVEFIEDICLEEALITNNVNCHQLALTAFSKQLKIRSAKSTQKFQSKIICFGGYNARHKVYDVYNSQGKKLSTYPNLPEGLQHPCVLQWNNALFCIGGNTDQKYCSLQPSDRVWHLDFKDKVLKWKKMVSMNEKRSRMGAAIDKEGLIVIAGGYNGHQHLSSVELYQMNEWKVISPLNEERSEHALVSCDRCFYALGGTNRNGFLFSVERLRDLDGHWEDIQPMQTPRRELAAVNCNGIVYAIGGKTHSTMFSLKSVERYDSVSNSWSYVRAMKHKRYSPSACVMNGKIYVVGGIDAGDLSVHDIECYDPFHDTWTIVGDSWPILLNHAVVAV